MNRIYKNIKLLVIIIVSQASVLMCQECDVCEFTVDELFFNESKYLFVENQFDSLEMGYKYHVKVFKINYEKFDQFLIEN